MFRAIAVPVRDPDCVLTLAGVGVVLLPELVPVGSIANVPRPPLIEPPSRWVLDEHAPPTSRVCAAWTVTAPSCVNVTGAGQVPLGWPIVSGA